MGYESRCVQKGDAYEFNHLGTLLKIWRYYDVVTRYIEDTVKKSYKLYNNKDNFYFRLFCFFVISFIKISLNPSFMIDLIKIYRFLYFKIMLFIFSFISHFIIWPSMKIFKISLLTLSVFNFVQQFCFTHNWIFNFSAQLLK